MNELLTIQSNEGFPVSGRELHERLEIDTPYTMWLPRMAEYGFTDGRDFLTKMLESTGGRPAVEHFMTIEMAKHVCMIQRTPQGMKIRQYLIDLETKWNDPDAVIERGYELAKKKLDVLRDQMFHLRLKTAEDAPKVLFADAVACADTTILIGELAKLLKGNGIEIGQNRLFQRLRLEGFLIRREATDYNMPTQRAMDMGLFRIKETAITHSDGHVTISKTVKVTGKGQQYFANYFLSSEPMQLSVLDGDNDGGESA